MLFVIHRDISTFNQDFRTGELKLCLWHLLLVEEWPLRFKLFVEYQSVLNSFGISPLLSGSSRASLILSSPLS